MSAFPPFFSVARFVRSGTPQSARLSGSTLWRARLRAFTLIEVVASLVMVGVLAALMMPLLSGTGVNATITGSAQLKGAYALRAEMEKAIHLYEETAPDQFDSLPTLFGNYFENAPNVATVETTWIEFTELPANIFDATISGVPSDHLRLTLGHATGQELTFLFSRPVT